MSIAVNSYRYCSSRSDEVLRERLLRLGRERPRYGYRRLQVLVEREGERVNHKRLYRVYREAGLCLKRRKRKRRVRAGLSHQQTTAANQEWALDFIHDVVAAGRAIRVLSVVDAHTRECLVLEGRHGIRQPPSDTGTGGSDRATRKAAGDPLRQRPRTNQPAFSSLVCGMANRSATHSAWQANAECASGELSRSISGRVPEGELVREPIRCTTQDRRLEAGLQRAAAAQQSRL
jgi:HTH-like domain